jgi:hypothetical protein
MFSPKTTKFSGILSQNVELFMDKGAAAYIEDPNKKMS